MVSNVNNNNMKEN